MKNEYTNNRIEHTGTNKAYKFPFLRSLYSWMVYTYNVIGQAHPVNKPDIANGSKSFQIRWFVGNADGVCQIIYFYSSSLESSFISIFL